MAVLAFFASRYLFSGVSVHNPSSLPLSPVVCNPRMLDLGTIVPGYKIEKHVDLISRSADAVELHRIESDCPCLVVRPARTVIAPGARVLLTVRFDPVSEPAFRGTLSIPVRGFDPAGAEVFNARVRVTVRDH